MSILNGWSSNSISNLFNSGSTGNNSYSGLSSMLSDYSAIRNGSYGKLMKSYYNETSNSNSSSRAKSSESVTDKIIREKMHPTVSSEASKANAALSQGVTNMKSSVSTLQNASTYEDTTSGTARSKVTNALKDYVTNYNSAVAASKDSTTKGLTSNMASIMKSTDANKEALAALGITANSDGTLSLDEKKLQSADLSAVQDLFSKDNLTSYGSTVGSRLQYASYYTSNTTTSAASSDTNSTKQETISSALGLKSASQALASDSLYDKVKDKDGNDTDSYNVDAITSKAKDFVKNYNEMFASAKNSTNSGVTSNLSYIKNTTDRNKDALASLGITVNSDNTLSINEDVFKNSDMSKVKALFKDYGSSVATNSSLVNYYMGTQATAASGYTSSASYNANAAAATYTAET